MKKLYLILINIFFLATQVFSQPAENLTFQDWDKNNDGIISRYEFVDKFTDNYVDDWDVNDDDHLDDEDFFRKSYIAYDADKDTLLTEKEWLFGYDYNFGEFVVDDFVAIDINNDGFVEYAEYYAALRKTSYFDTWDVDDDNYLDQFELARLVFNSWDFDDSNFIEIDEYDAFDDYYLDI